VGRRLPVPSMCYRHRRTPVVLIQPSQTETNAQGQSTTIVWRAIRANKEDRVAKLEWAPGGGLGRAVIGKVRPSLQRSFPFDVFLTLPFDHTEPRSYGRLGPPRPKNARACFGLVSISYSI